MFLSSSSAFYALVGKRFEPIWLPVIKKCILLGKWVLHICMFAVCTPRIAGGRFGEEANLLSCLTLHWSPSPPFMPAPPPLSRLIRQRWPRCKNISMKWSAGWLSCSAGGGPGSDACHVPLSSSKLVAQWMMLRDHLGSRVTRGGRECFLLSVWAKLCFIVQTDQPVLH